MIPIDEEPNSKVKAKFEMTGLPHWLLPDPVRGEINERSWEELLTAIASGDPLTLALNDYCRVSDKREYARVLRWIHADPEREAQYKEAKRIGTEMKRSVIELHSMGYDENGEPTMNDVSRDSLVVNTYKWLMAKDNREVYGEHRQVEEKVTIDIGDAMLEAQRRVDNRLRQTRDIEGEVINGKTD